MKRLCAVVFLLSCCAAIADAKEEQFRSEEITFKSAGDVSLSGSLTLPNGSGPHPAIVMLGGSERLSRNAIYNWANAEQFVAQGIAVFTFDSPGTGKSEGNRFGRTHQERTDDALAAIRAIAAREDIKGDSVGLYGASEGGLVVFRAAARPKGIAFGIAIASPTAPDFEDTNFTVQSLATACGLNGADVEKLVTFNHLACDLVRNHSTINFAELDKKVAEWNEPGWSQLLSLVQKRTDRNREATKDSFIAIAQKWNGEKWFQGTKMLLETWKQLAKQLEIDVSTLGIDFNDQNIAKQYVELFYVVGTSKIVPDPSRDVDPVSFLKEIRCPMLCVYGENDPLVRGAPIIRKVFGETKHGDFIVKIIPGADHQLKVTEGDRTARHKGVDTFIQDWVQERLRKAQ